MASSKEGLKILQHRFGYTYIHNGGKVSVPLRIRTLFQYSAQKVTKPNNTYYAKTKNTPVLKTVFLGLLSLEQLFVDEIDEQLNLVADLNVNDSSSVTLFFFYFFFIQQFRHKHGNSDIVCRCPEQLV